MENTHTHTHLENTSIFPSLHMSEARRDFKQSCCTSMFLIYSIRRPVLQPTRSSFSFHLVLNPLPSILCSSVIHTRQTWDFKFDIWHKCSPPTDSIWAQQEVWAHDQRNRGKNSTRTHHGQKSTVLLLSFL